MGPGVSPLALEFNPFRVVEPNTDTRFSPFRVEGLIINLASLRFVLLVALGLLLLGDGFLRCFFGFPFADHMRSGQPRCAKVRWATEHLTTQKGVRYEYE